MACGVLLVFDSNKLPVHVILVPNMNSIKFLPFNLGMIHDDVVPISH